MTILNTAIFTWLYSALSLLWNDVTGRIFLLTFLAYASSYTLYSGYLSSFAKGFGSLPLSQIGFNITDLLTLIPASFLLLLKALNFLFKFIAFHFALPIAVAYLTSAILLSPNWEQQFGGNITAANYGVLIWMISVAVGAFFYSHRQNVWIASVIAGCLGAILFGLTISSSGYDTTNSQLSVFNSPIVLGVSSLINQILAPLLIAELCFVPFAIGMTIGDLSIEEKLLSEISQLTLNKAIPLKGSTLSKAIKNGSNSSETFEYKWTEEKPIYLIAIFSQTAAIFIPTITHEEERGQMLLIRNELINTMILKGYKGNQTKSPEKETKGESIDKKVSKLKGKKTVKK